MKRIDGQIWIERESPYRLKYHINGVDYVVQVAASYELGNDVEQIAAGTVVKFADKENAIEPAVFPDDIGKVLGIALNSSSSDTQGGPDQIAVTQIGYLILEGENLKKVFPIEDDLDLTKNGWVDENGGIGANIYWFIGKTVNTDGTYSYIDSINYPGCLTTSTPSGYEKIDPSDESLNVSYDNLPTIGTVIGYESENNIINKFYINVNFTAFDESIEWSWPGVHTEDCGKINKEDPVKNYLTIRHGLFADTHSDLSNLRMSCYADLLASEISPSEESLYTIKTRLNNIYTGDDRKTILDVFTPEDLYYRVNGVVHYNVDRNHQ